MGTHYLWRGELCGPQVFHQCVLRSDEVRLTQAWVSPFEDVPTTRGLDQPLLVDISMLDPTPVTALPHVILAKDFCHTLR
jgi:hypothetical protein